MTFKVKKYAPPVVVGWEAVSKKTLKKLIDKLASRSSHNQIAAIDEFASQSSAFSKAADDNHEVSKNEFMDLIIAAVMKNQDQMLKKFEKEKKKKPLLYLATSTHMPFQVRHEAAKAVKRLKIDQMQAKHEIEAPKDIKLRHYPQQKVSLLVRKLESPKHAERIEAAIKFVHDYPKITHTVSKMPDISVTSVTQKALKVIKEEPKIVVEVMKQNNMVPELLFVAALKQLPEKVRAAATKTADELKKDETPFEIVASHSLRHKKPIKELQETKIPETKIPERTKAAKKPELPEYDAPVYETKTKDHEFSMAELQTIVVALERPQSIEAADAAIKFIKNYDTMIELISKSHLYKVTDVTQKVISALKRRIPYVLQKLEHQRDEKALRLLAYSARMPEEVRNKALQVLLALKAAKNSSLFDNFKKE